MMMVNNVGGSAEDRRLPGMRQIDVIITMSLQPILLNRGYGNTLLRGKDNEKEKTDDDGEDGEDREWGEEEDGDGDGDGEGRVKEIVMTLLFDLLMFYHDYLEGVVVAFDEIEFVEEESARIIGEMPDLIVEVMTTLTYFKPRRGETLTGKISHIGPDFVDILIYGLFNGQIQKKDVKAFEERAVGDDVTMTVTSTFLERCSSGAGAGSSGMSRGLDLVFVVRGVEV